MPRARTTTRRNPGRPRSERRASAYEFLKQAIMKGELTAGEQLVEANLAEWCNVSRTPVREALTRLEHDGLVQRSDRGLIVRESSPEEILDLYDTRIVLESRAAAVAADRRTDFDLLSMRRAAERVRRATDDGANVIAQRNREFHQTVWQASHNGSLTDLLQRLNLHLGRYPATTLVYPGRAEAANREHDEIIEAIAERNSTRAADAATRHFTTARDIRLKLWESE